MLAYHVTQLDLLAEDVIEITNRYNRVYTYKDTDVSCFGTYMFSKPKELFNIIVELGIHVKYLEKSRKLYLGIFSLSKSQMNRFNCVADEDEILSAKYSKYSPIMEKMIAKDDSNYPYEAKLKEAHNLQVEHSKSRTMSTALAYTNMLDEICRSPSAVKLKTSRFRLMHPINKAKHLKGVIKINFIGDNYRFVFEPISCNPSTLRHCKKFTDIYSKYTEQEKDLLAIAVNHYYPYC